MTGGLLVKSAVTMTYARTEKSDNSDNDRHVTYRDSHELADLLNLVARRKGLQSLKVRRELLLRQEALMGGLGLSGLLLVGAAEDNFVLFVVIFVEESLLVMHGTRCDLHLKRVLLGILLYLHEMLVITVLGKPGDNITRRPVDAKRVSMLIVDVILEQETIQISS